MTTINKNTFQNYYIKKNTHKKKNDHENWYQSKTHHLK